jgi:hypothetical protein
MRRRIPWIRRQRWFIRVPLRLLQAAVVAALLYLGLANLFLSTSAFEDVVDADPGTLEVHFERGWTLWPGRLHARGLSIRGRDGNVEWWLRIDDVDFRVSLTALLRKQFFATQVRGTGVSLRLRQRIGPEELARTRVADLPPIEGLRPIPLRPFRQDSADEYSDEYWHLWTIRLSDVVADNVREVWIDHDRFEGDARVEGGFSLKPIRAVTVGPVTVEVRAGSVTRGDETWADAIAGRAVVTMATFDPRVTSGQDFLRNLSLETDLALRVPALERLPVDLPPDVQVRGAVDVPRLAVNVSFGVPQYGVAAWPRHGRRQTGVAARRRRARRRLAPRGRWHGGSCGRRERPARGRGLRVVAPVRTPRRQRQGR